MGGSRSRRGEWHDRTLLRGELLRLAEKCDEFGLALRHIAFVVVGQHSGGRVDAESITVEHDVHVQSA